ncbi:hypothetical protein DYQ86_20930 [Acidobacteria bacterium AB60]|nr:hypothetical protein DYQ86_20930 [Acidobacteria bacterium AB60]
MKRILTAIVCLLMGAVMSGAQTVDAKVCDILAHPKDFDGKIVRVTGTVVAGFDEFMIRDNSCKQSVNAIWLDYPIGTKAKTGPVAIITLQLAKNSPGQATLISATPVTLDTGGDFKKFDSTLSASAKTSGRCLGCVRSTVTATLTGRLDAVDAVSLEKTGSMFTAVKGFGNLARYPVRLVIQSVANVSENDIDYSKPADLGDGDVDLGLTADQLKRAAAAYGAQGEDNGVDVGFTGANTLRSNDGAKGSGNSPDGLLLIVTIDGDRVKGTAISEAMAHTGTHIADLRESPMRRNLFELEGRAWGATVMSALTNKEKTLTLPGGYVAWNSGWTEVDQKKQLPGALSGYLTQWAGLSR